MIFMRPVTKALKLSCSLITCAIAMQSIQAAPHAYAQSVRVGEFEASYDISDALDTSLEDSLSIESSTGMTSGSVRLNASGLNMRAGKKSSGDKMSAKLTVPMNLAAVEGLEAEVDFEDLKDAMPFDIRQEAIKEAAISYGARAGLAWRTYYIRREMDRRARSLDRIYNFGQLLIPAPSGLLIEPPIISENVNAMIIEGDGQQAAVSDRIYNIMNNAKIVSTARTWRTYLERNWGDVKPPPDILRPRDDEERRLWVRLVRKGWKEGVKQANEIFEQDLNTLITDFEGMIRYRMLLAQGMVSAPYALQVDRGVTGGGDEMRIGDRAVQITGKPSLITGHDRWQPASR